MERLSLEGKQNPCVFSMNGSTFGVECLCRWSKQSLQNFKPTVFSLFLFLLLSELAHIPWGFGRLPRCSTLARFADVCKSKRSLLWVPSAAKQPWRERHSSERNPASLLFRSASFSFSLFLLFRSRCLFFHLWRERRAGLWRIGVNGATTSAHPPHNPVFLLH